MRERNPVALMDSVDAMDLLNYAHRRLQQFREDPRQLARIKEQERRHQWALRRHIDGNFDREDKDDEARKKELTRKKPNLLLGPRRSK